jgi:hypothetical protein
MILEIADYDKFEIKIMALIALRTMAVFET